MFSPPLKKSIVFLKYALKMDLVKGAWFDLYDKDDISHTIRVIQHEMSHMFGCLDSPHDSEKLCTMNGGYDNFPLYTENIWCLDCRNGIFVRSSHQGL